MNHDAMVSAILSHFDNATPAQMEAGAQWYLRANEIARDIADETDLPVPRAAAIIAHLSPRCSWRDNVRRAWQLACEGTTDGLSRSVDNARAALAGDIAFGQSAHKTAAFYGNILGQDYRVTVDTWAARVAGVPDADLSNAKTYAAVESAYCEAAMLRAVSPSTMQAVTWCVVRGSAE